MRRRDRYPPLSGSRVADAAEPGWYHEPRIVPDECVIFCVLLAGVSMSIIDQLAAIESAALAALHDITTVDALTAWKSE